MRILKNKYFILGNVLLLLISIPLTLFFINQQQDLRSRAAPSSTLSITPATAQTTTACSEFTVDITLNPGQNEVSIVDLYLTFDPSFLKLLRIDRNEASFPTVVRNETISNGAADISLSVGPNVTSAITSTTKVVTLAFQPLQITSGTASIIAFDTAKTRVYSLSSNDAPTENVLSSANPGNVTITQNATCPTGGQVPPSTTITPTPTGSGIGGGGNPTPTTSQNNPTPTLSQGISPTLSPTSGANQNPVCTDLSVSPQSAGSAPFAVLFTGQGSDDGTLTKATFDYGDGDVDDVTSGLGGSSVTIQQSHTYNTVGTFSAKLTFTDNLGAISASCTQGISVDGESVTTTPSPTTGNTTPTNSLTSTPTIDSPGSLTLTAGVAGGIVLILLIGIFLILL